MAQTWGGRRAQQAAEQVKALRRPCCICGQRIDYSLPPDDAMAFTLEHLKPRSTHPELMYDPSNWAAAHATCNKARGNRALQPGLGTTTALL